jgi:hypothetical protein
MVRLVVTLTFLISFSLAINLNESFTERNFPPLGWRVVNYDNGNYTWERDSTNSRTPPGCVSSCYESSKLRNNDWLITPKLFCFGETPDTLKFWYKKALFGNSESLEVWLSNTENNVQNFTHLLWAKKFSNLSYTEKRISLDNFDGQEIYIAFVNKGDYAGRLCLDDISGPQMEEIKDVGVDSIIFPRSFTIRPVGIKRQPQAIIKNYSNSTQYNVPVICSIMQNALLYTNQQIIDSLSLNSEKIVSFDSFPLTAPGRCTIKVITVLLGDTNPSNNFKIKYAELISGVYTGGPDNNGYSWIDSDTAGGPEYNWIDISATGAQLMPGDAWVVGPISIGFPFYFYGQLKEDFWYSTNGFISLDSLDGSYNRNTALPNGNLPNSIIAPFWDDLYTDEAIYQRFGVMPNRFLIVQWKSRVFRQGGFRDTIIFQVILHENGDIVYQYNFCGNHSMAQGESATVGIENPLGMSGLSYLYNGEPRGNLLSSCRAIRFFRDCHDLALDTILTNEVGINETISPAVVVKNLGTYNEEFQVKIVIYDGQNIIYEDSSFIYELLPGSSQNISLRPWTSNRFGTYLQKAWVSLPSDINPENDTFYASLSVTLSAPTLLLPSDGAITNNSNIFFDWSDVVYANQYNIRISGSRNLDTITSTSQLGPITLPEGNYYWQVRAGNPSLWGRFSNFFWFSVDRTPPPAPTLIYPPHSCTLNITRPVFIWHSRPGVFRYELVVFSAHDTLFRIELQDTSYQLTNDLANGKYFWKVRARDLAGNWSSYSASNTFYLQVIWWHRKADIPLLPSSKSVSDGGSITSSGNKIYAIKGNNTQDFYCYDIAQGNWQVLCSVPYLEGSLKKKVKGGGAIVASADRIYLIKGNSTKEFWEFNPTTNNWVSKPSVPSLRNVRSGSALAYNDSIIYCLLGSNSRFEFYRYLINEQRWEILASAPGGLNNQLFKTGSAISYGGNQKLYVLKGGSRENEFYEYDINNNSWSEKSYLPLTHFQVRKTKKVRAGGALAYDGQRFIYAIKGGRSKEFWRYDINNNSWQALETIPRVHKTRSVPEKGASLVVSQGQVWLLKGNKTLEFWQYSEGSGLTSKSPQPSRTSDETVLSKSVLEIREISFKGERKKIILPNDNARLTVNYKISTTHRVRITIFDASGRARLALDKGLLPKGVYQEVIDTSSLAAGIYFIEVK